MNFGGYVTQLTVRQDRSEISGITWTLWQPKVGSQIHLNAFARQILSRSFNRPQSNPNPKIVLRLELPQRWNRKEGAISLITRVATALQKPMPRTPCSSIECLSPGILGFSFASARPGKKLSTSIPEKRSASVPCKRKLSSFSTTYWNQVNTLNRNPKVLSGLKKQKTFRGDPFSRLPNLWRRCRHTGRRNLPHRLISRC